MPSHGIQSDTDRQPPQDEQVLERWVEAGVQYERVLTADAAVVTRRVDENVVLFEG
jgi:hypothetical protein